MFSQIHALHLETMLFLLQLCQFRVLETLQLRFIGLLLQLHKLILYLEHMKPIRCEEVLLVLLEHMVQFRVEVLNLFGRFTKQLANTSHVVQVSALRDTLAILRRLCSFY